MKFLQSWQHHVVAAHAFPAFVEVVNPFCADGLADGITGIAAFAIEGEAAWIWVLRIGPTIAGISLRENSLVNASTAPGLLPWLSSRCRSTGSPRTPPALLMSSIASLANSDRIWVFTPSSESLSSSAISRLLAGTAACPGVASGRQRATRTGRVTDSTPLGPFPESPRRRGWRQSQHQSVISEGEKLGANRIRKDPCADFEAT